MYLPILDRNYSQSLYLFILIYFGSIVNQAISTVLNQSQYKQGTKKCRHRSPEQAIVVLADSGVV